jgi:hypothetical protein
MIFKSLEIFKSIHPSIAYVILVEVIKNNGLLQPALMWRPIEDHWNN